MYANSDAVATWSETQILTAFDAAAGDNFGRAVALYNTTLVVGAHQYYDNAKGMFMNIMCLTKFHYQIFLIIM